MIEIFTLIVRYSIFFYKQHSVSNPASLAKSLQEGNSEGQYLHVRAEGFRAKILFDNFSPEKTLRYRRPS